jgi:hypothetical protein
MKKLIAILSVSVLMAACSSDGQRFVKSPIDNLIRDMDQEKNFTVLLYDMDMEDNFGGDKYKHKYKIVTMKDTVPQERVTDWLEVDEATFLENENNMGMEIASKVDGKLSKAVAPPGYSQYVGNEKYGNWRTNSDGTSFWEFYGQYAMMSSMLGLASGMINRNSYYDYRGNYMGTGRPYYGALSDGRPMYGTYSDHGKRANPDFHNRPGGGSAFKNKVNDRVSRSNSSGRTRSSGSSYSSGSSKRSSGSSSSSSRRSSGGRRRR